MSTEKVSRRGLLKKLFSPDEVFADGKKETEEPYWVMVIDLQKCIGCDTCTVSCKAENRTPPGVTYNVVIQEEFGTFPNVSRVNTPRPCMQCKKAPCVQVCPTEASYKTEDGVTAVDYQRCIGCRQCMTACPYGARYFDFGHDYTQEMVGFNDYQAPEYGIDWGKRKDGESPVGVPRKCTFCHHRRKRGQEPACVETCLGDARYFGNINDPDSKVAELAASSRAFLLKEEIGTEPNVIYLK